MERGCLEREVVSRGGFESGGLSEVRERGSFERGGIEGDVCERSFCFVSRRGGFEVDANE